MDFRGRQHTDERRSEIDPQGVPNCRLEPQMQKSALDLCSSLQELKVLSENWQNGGYRRFFYDHDLNKWNNWNFWNLGHRCAQIMTSRYPSSSVKTAPYWNGRRISAFTNQ